jgi:hypothetical protein
MTRPSLLLACALTWLSVPAAAVRADTPWWETDRVPELFDAVGPLDAKALARAQFAAVHADPKELARAQLEVARLLYAAREREFLEGRGTLNFLLDASRKLLQAERAADPGAAGQAAALARHSARCGRIEAVEKERYDAGRVSLQDYLETRYARLEAEIELGRAVAPGKTAAAGLPAPPAERGAGALDKGPARARFQAARAGVGALAQARLETARAVYAAGEKEFLACRGTLQFFLDAGRHLLDSELAVATRDDDRRAALERHWARVWCAEAMNEARWDAGRISFKDYMETRRLRLDAELRLAEAWAGRETPAPSGFQGVPPAWADGLDTKDLARARFQAGHADPKEMSRAKVRAARVSYVGRLKEAVAGRPSLEFVLDAARQFLEDERAVHPLPADRLTALQWYCRQTFLIEWMYAGWFAAGRVPVQQYQETRYRRLEAEIQLAKAWARKGNR